MSTEKLRVGVIGTSWWADQEHLPGLQARPDVDIVALCGRNPERLEAMAAKYNVRQTFTDWRRMVARAGLDVLVILTPNVLHHPQAMAAIDLGLHIICEKPLALNAAQARELAARADAANVKTLVFFAHRTVGAAVHVKRLVSEGLLGRPLYVNAMYFSASHLDPNKPLAWRNVRAEAGVGVLGDIGSHLIDLVRWWLGDFSCVIGQWQTAFRERPGGVADADDACAFLAQLACGAQATFQPNKLMAGRGNYQRIELAGTEGSLIYEAEPGYDETWEGRLYAGRAGAYGLRPVRLPKELNAGLKTPDETASRNEAYRRLTDPFFEAIHNGGPVSPDFHDGAAVQAVIDAVAQSIETGKWVNVT
jgi:predicted dehydrogenase